MYKFSDPKRPECSIECPEPNGFARYRPPIGPCEKDCGETSNANSLKEWIEEEGIDARFSIDAKMDYHGLSKLHPIISESTSATKQLRQLLKQIDDDVAAAGSSIVVHVTLSNTDAQAFLEAIYFQIKEESDVQ